MIYEKEEKGEVMIDKVRKGKKSERKRKRKNMEVRKAKRR